MPYRSWRGSRRGRCVVGVAMSFGASSIVGLRWGVLCQVGEREIGNGGRGFVRFGSWWGLTCDFWVVFEGGWEDLFCPARTEGVLGWCLRWARAVARERDAHISESRYGAPAWVAAERFATEVVATCPDRGSGGSGGRLRPGFGRRRVGGLAGTS